MAVVQLRAMYDKADAVDRREGCLAYARYHGVMEQIASLYDLPLDRVTAAFVALSPNSDYVGNLRSLISMLDAMEMGVPAERVIVSTYKHCRDRAAMYLNGTPFLDHAKGLKTRAFYSNVLDPTDPVPVTVDGHIMAAWCGENMTMKEAKVSSRVYQQIADDMRELSAILRLLPNQLQATIWFARKRTLEIKYDPQMDLFLGGDDQWKTGYDVRRLRPYGGDDERRSRSEPETEDRQAKFPLG